MRKDPIRLLASHAEVLDLRFFEKEDNVSGDGDLATLLGTHRIVGLRQMHGRSAVIAREPSSRVIEADAVATDVPGLVLSVRFADCQGAVIFAPKARVLALVHAGWRGVVASVCSATYELLKKEWGIDPKDTIVGLAPSLCTACAEFTDPETEVPTLRPYVTGRNVDLRSALENELRSLGVRDENVERMEGCTRCDPKRFWTYRGGDQAKVREGFVNGFAACIRE